MDFKKKSPFKLSLTNNYPANSKFITFHDKHSKVKASTPLRHKKNDLFSPNNTAPIKFQQSYLQDQSSPFHNLNFMNFSDHRKEGQSKKRDRIHNLKQNIPVNSPTLFSKMIKANNQGNQHSCRGQFNKNRIQTQPPFNQEKLIIDKTFSVKDKQIFQQRILKNVQRNDANIFVNFFKKDKGHQYQHGKSLLNNLTTKDSLKKEPYNYCHFQSTQKAICDPIQCSSMENKKDNRVISNKSLVCQNNDGKAKYRVISHQLQQEEDLFYCSKCTISLVQQGFILEEIDDYNIDATELQRTILINLLEKQHESLIQKIEDMRKKELFDLNQINKFYNQVIDTISFCQTKNIQTIQNFYEKKNQQMNLQRVNLQNLMFSLSKQPNFTKIQILQFSKIQKQRQKTKLFIKINEIDYLKRIILAQFQPKIEEISSNLSTLLKEKVQIESQQKQQIEQYIYQAMRFSFQKKPSSSQIDVRYNYQKQNKLKQFKEELDSQKEIKQQCTAFRDLFPEEDSSSIKTEISSPTFKNF